MRTVGIVVEYNPFHNGHLYHVRQAKKVSEADAVVAVMSGYFLQRGEPALVDKWTRAEMALHSGVDLVLEIPVVYACHVAEWFAYGAVATLEATGVVDALCFGSESGDLKWMEHAVKTAVNEPEPFRRALQRYLKKGWSYPQAYAQALNDMHPIDGDELAKPNNILGLNYLIALKKLCSPIIPLTIQREKAGYHQSEPSDTSIASATSIRKMWLETKDIRTIRPYVPSPTYNLLHRVISKGSGPITWESFHQAVVSRIIACSTEELRTYYEVDEGLEYRLKEHLDQAKSIAAYLTALKTKRYTWNRLQRVLAYILLGLSKEQVTALSLQNGPTYLRVLGFTDRGRALLKKMRQTAALPVVTRVEKRHPSMLDWDLRAAALYALATNWKMTLKEELRPPVYVN